MIETVAVVSTAALAVTSTDPNVTGVTVKLQVAARALEKKPAPPQRQATTARIATQRKKHSHLQATGPIETWLSPRGA